ncbi:SMP-30/gluconolactonase/LRE family protein [Pelagibacterium lacus]|uniref:SMP-30/gluconolactonase/LRE family protein n=1 Tax=Pelagibacterium lacus TaxID=2282655 RepID=A0A369W4Q1_9HYPH|nr:SMP-30/gluconolactonase/LRE family protein [Pelagibacterium lacus]RDE09674.1 SMP-30/gluconolactonase/LRE family protein [Pelagibacterium lacus]
MTAIEMVADSKNRVGEVPVWSPRDRKVWWIDVRQPRIQSYDPDTGAFETFLTGGNVLGSYAIREQGGFMLAQEDGLYAFDAATGERTLLVDPEADFPDHRLNDGRCDRKGRFWLGSMNDKQRTDDGSFYSVGPDLAIAKWFDGINIPNGVCFSPDDKVMYFADTPKKMIWAFDFDIEEGRISNRRVFADLKDAPGRPDGSTVDAEGFVWNAEFAGRRIVRYTPDGRVDRVIDMPVTNITCLGFGGDNLDQLYITTAWQGLSDEQRAAEPLAGALFRTEVGVRGLPEPMFAG